MTEKITIKISNLIEQAILLSMLCLVFLYDVFVESIGVLDEFIGILALIVIIFMLLVKKRITLFKNEMIIGFLLISVVLLGFTSNYFSCHKGYCTDSIAIFADSITFSKAFIAYFAVRLLSQKFDSEKTLKKVSKYSEIVFYILILYVILDLIFKIYPRENRYGLNSIELFFRHTSRYAFAFSFIFLVLLSKHYKKKIGLLFLIIFIGALSLRVKYFGFVFISMIFLFYGKKLIRTPKPVFFWSLGILITLMVFIFKEKILMYFSFENLEDAWSRAVVLYYSFIIGADYFPLGTGFGTYSSYYSGAYYSWVYDLYGISNVYGIKRTYWKFIADQYWPMILGQFGYIGLMSMLFVMYNYLVLFLNVVKTHVHNNKNYFLYLSVLLGLLMLLIDSTSDAIFSQQRAVAIFIYFALVMNTVKNRENITNK
ncbi:hypothetical protein [Winogradskyella flava]|uniref:Oligosaccharide repeat unit polymerase n=1 Tax=Winogradskyella flava TaxID=1884876 RepID=A0A842IMH7_9FLAO|nr:hypothetical protein [Winogradskyella flava]MBC2843855.1 hypothetical protein [Winogradskyella flava]